ncbi:flippase [Pluralibacter gergoviae]|nr:flippase [Pluralibacter gergoviae]ELW9443380.1 flippase [Pluralibacter gergoviae]
MSIIKNSIWNLVGYVIPSIIAIPALGFMARKLGAELFGIYTIAIAIVGYAGIFDMGLTRAITREIAIFRGDKEERRRIISSATAFLTILSLVGAGCIFLGSGYIAGFLKISTNKFDDINSAIKLLSLSIPLFLVNQLWTSILEGDERFKVVNLQKTVTSSIIAGMPAMFVFISPTFFYAILGLLIARVSSLVIVFSLVKKDILISGAKIYAQTLRRLIFFGGWITLSNIISPAMVYFDRLVISNLLGAKHVAFYTGPSEAVSRLGILPAAVGRAIFPRLSYASEPDDIRKNLNISYILMVLICAPVVVLGVVFSKSILDIWLGDLYALHSSMILKILLVGFLFNAIAQVPFSAIQSSGKAKLTAILHCIEIVPYFTLLYFLTTSFGLIGVAYAWSVRVIIDCLILIFISESLLRAKNRKLTSKYNY